MTIRVGVHGATGYTGLELVAWLMGHPEVAIAWATSRGDAGRSLAEVAAGAPDVGLIDPADADPAAADVVMLCLPHGAAAPTAAAALAAGARVVDLSADFRLRDPEAYAAWYGAPHPAPALLEEAVYGLTEWARAELPAARLVANPGCYPTSILLPLAPLVRAGAVAPEATLVADSKSGVSGAGRAAKLHTSFVEVADNFMPYGVGRRHRHLPEIEQALGAWAAAAGAAPAPLLFTPHLLPVPRGILSTLYVPLAADWDAARARTALEAAYGGEPFVTVLPDGATASLAHVTRTNRCVMSLHAADTARGRTLIVASALDNLVKGAAGQAVQNLNLMCGLDETAGLRRAPAP